MSGSKDGRGGDRGGFDDAWSEIVDKAEQDTSAKPAAKPTPTKPAKPVKRRKKSQTLAWTEEVRGEAKREGTERSSVGSGSTGGEGEGEDDGSSGTLNWTDGVRASSLDERPKLDFNPIKSVQAAVKSAWAEEVPDDAPVKSELTTAELDTVDDDKKERPSSDLKTAKDRDDKASGATASGVFDVFVPPGAPASDEDLAMDRVMSEAEYVEPVPQDDSIPPPSPSVSGASMPILTSKPSDPTEQMAKVMAAAADSEAEPESEPEPEAEPEEDESEEESEEDESEEESEEDESEEDESEEEAESGSASQTGRRTKRSETVPDVASESRAASSKGTSGRIWWAAAALSAGVAFVVLNRDDDPEPKPKTVAQAPSKAPIAAEPKPKPVPEQRVEPDRPVEPKEPPKPPEPVEPPEPTEPAEPVAEPPDAPEESPVEDPPEPPVEPETPEPPPLPRSGDPRAVPPGTPPEVAAVFVRLPVSAADKPPVGGIGKTGIHIDDVGLGNDYAGGECRGEGQRFSVSGGDRVNVCMRVVHQRQRETLQVSWEQEGGTLRRANVLIKPNHAYRTRALLVLRSEYVGKWRVKIESEDGVVLASSSFEVVE